jgi:hypothetical protein
MPEFVLIDEIHLTVLVPAGLPDDSARAIAATLAAEDFLARLTAAVLAVVRTDPAPAGVRVVLTR